jgi:putative ATP-dependent endonuclease of OLD family
VFSDGEPQPLTHLERALHKTGRPKAVDCQNVVVIPGGLNFETQLVAEGYLPEIEATLDLVMGKAGYLDDYIARFDGKPGKNGTMRDYKTADGRQRAACDALSENKTRMAEPLASTLAAIADEGRRFPAHIRTLFQKISGEHGLKQVGKEVS